MGWAALDDQVPSREGSEVVTGSLPEFRSGDRLVVNGRVYRVDVNDGGRASLTLLSLRPEDLPDRVEAFVDQCERDS